MAPWLMSWISASPGRPGCIVTGIYMSHLWHQLRHPAKIAPVRWISPTSHIGTSQHL